MSDEGMKTRREVLGDEHVDRAVANTTEFTAEFQDLITRYAWGEIWSRPGLDRRTRSCITITALVATGREHELAMHVRAALRNGVTPDELKEVLLQCAVYCGVPAANGAFAIAQRVLDEERRRLSRARTQVGIVGAGPAGLTLGHLLHLQGIDTVIVEDRSREYVEARVRAGVIEQGIVDLLTAAGAGQRLHREGLVHHGIELQFAGERHRIPLSDLTDGRAIVIYGQTEVVKDLIALRLESGRPLHFDVDDVSVHDLETERPRIRYRHEGRDEEIECEVIAGCDGFHGICRPSVPAGVLSEFSREYPFGWLGILAEVRAVERRARLRPPRPRLRAPEPPLTGAEPSLRPVPPRRGSRGVAGRSHLGGAPAPPRTRRAGRSPRDRSSRRA